MLAIRFAHKLYLQESNNELFYAVSDTKLHSQQSHDCIAQREGELWSIVEADGGLASDDPHALVGKPNQ